MKRLSCVTLLFLAGCSQLTSYPYPECEEIVQYFNGAKSLAHHTCTIRGGKLVNVFNFWVDQRSNSRGKAPAPPSD